MSKKKERGVHYSIPRNFCQLEFDPEKQRVPMGLYQKYRPRKFDNVVGQPGVVKSIQAMVKKKDIPHAVMFTGPSGCGKTTLARIIAKHLECSKIDLVEVNAAEDRGIDMIRGITTRANARPLNGKSRVWILDEAHQMNKFAQNALLKALEDPPSHAYFIICTTDPSKLLKTIHTRCTEFKLKAVGDKDLTSLIQHVWKKEGNEKELSDEVCERICEVVEGSPRKALVILEQIINLESEDKMLDAIQSAESRQYGINLARAMLDTRNVWADVAKILREMEDDPETVRQIVMSYCTTIMLKVPKMAKRAAWILNNFREPIYSAPKQLLALACYECYNLSP